MRRAKLLGDFWARHPGKLAGVQIDVEPHQGEQWREGDTAHRRARLRSLTELLCSIRPHLRGLPLGVAVAWWYPAKGEELPEAAPAALFAVVDEIYLMTYGDKQGPRVGGTADRVLARVDRPEFFRSRARLRRAGHLRVSFTGTSAGRTRKDAPPSGFADQLCRDRRLPRRVSV